MLRKYDVVTVMSAKTALTMTVLIKSVEVNGNAIANVITTSAESDSVRPGALTMVYPTDIYTVMEME